MWCGAKCCVLYHTAGEIVTFSTTSVTSVRTGDTFSSRRRLGHCCAGWFFDTLGSPDGSVAERSESFNRMLAGGKHTLKNAVKNL